MPDTFPQATDEQRRALREAFAVLQQQESELLKKFVAIQAKLEGIRSAIASVRSVIGAIEGTFDEAEAQRALLTEADNAVLAGLPFSQALRLLLDTQTESLSVREITQRFKESGWTFRSSDFADQSNQVGVTLRRGEGKFFFRTLDNKWSTNPKASGVHELSGK